MNKLCDSIECIRLYPVAAKKTNRSLRIVRRVPEVQYYEGLSVKERAEIDRVYPLKKFYIRIRVTAYVKAAIDLIVAAISFYLAFLIYGTFYDHFEYAKNCFLHLVRGDVFDISDLMNIILYAVLLLGVLVFSVIVNVVSFFRKRAINKESRVFVDNISRNIETKIKYKIILESVGENIGAVIQAIEEVSELKLIEAKSIIEHMPVTIKEGLGKTEAEQVIKKFNDVGAVAVMSGKICN